MMRRKTIIYSICLSVLFFAVAMYFFSERKSQFICEGAWSSPNILGRGIDAHLSYILSTYNATDVEVSGTGVIEINQKNYPLRFMIIYKFSPVTNSSKYKATVIRRNIFVSNSVPSPLIERMFISEGHSEYFSFSKISNKATLVESNHIPILICVNK